MLKTKLLNKVVYTILAALIIYNSFGYLLLYFPVRTIIKEVVQNSIEEKKIDQENLQVLAFSLADLNNDKLDFEWEKPDKEFRFNGDMYDVEDKKVTSDSVYYICYYDHKENILESVFELHLISQNKDKTNHSLQRIIMAAMFAEEFRISYSKFYDEDIINIPLLKKEAALLNPVKNIPTPPPRMNS